MIASAFNVIGQVFSSIRSWLTSMRIPHTPFTMWELVLVPLIVMIIIIILDKLFTFRK